MPHFINHVLTHKVTDGFLLGVPEFHRVKNWTLDDNEALMETTNNLNGMKELLQNLEVGKIAERKFCELTPFCDNTVESCRETDCINPKTGITAEIKFDKVAIYSAVNLTSDQKAIS